MLNLSLWEIVCEVAILAIVLLVVAVGVTCIDPKLLR